MSSQCAEQIRRTQFCSYYKLSTPKVAFISIDMPRGYDRPSIVQPASAHNVW